MHARAHVHDRPMCDHLVPQGMDIACANYIGKHGAAALAQGLISEALIDERLRNLFRVRMRLGHFDPPGESACGR